MMTESIITIKCFDSAVYTLNFPAFVAALQVSKLKTLFTYLMRYHFKSGNEDTIHFLDENLPKYVEDTRKDWILKSKEFSDNYLNTDRRFLPNSILHLSRKEIAEEIKRRKEYNNELERDLKDAKRNFEHAQKVFETYTKIKTIYD